MKRMFAFVFGLATVTSAPAAIVYQGRLATANGALTLKDVVDKKMTFRVYDEKGAERWSTNLTVTVATDGSFSAVLDAPELTAAIAEDKAATVGLTVGDAPELQPRRRLLPVPVVERANTVSRLDSATIVERLNAKGLVCGDLVSASEVKVFGTFDTPGPVRLRQCVVGEYDTLKIGRGLAGVSALGEPIEPVVGDCLSAGESLAKAPSDGLVFVSEVRTSKGRLGFDETHVVGSSFVQFCKAGDEITSPVDIENYRVIFYPFRTDAK